MKKKIASIVMATAIMATNVANAAINVVHFDQNKNLTYDYTLETVQDFSFDLTGTHGINPTTEQGYGNVLAMSAGQSYTMEMDEAVGGNGSKYLLSFDMKVTKGDFNRLHLGVTANTSTDIETFTETELFMTYAGSFFQEGTVWGNNYKIYDSEWTHVDLIFCFDDNLVHVYTKGGNGSYWLTVDGTRDINQIKALRFWFSNPSAATERGTIDNVFFGPIHNANEVKSGTIKRVSTDKLELGFNSTLHSTTDVEANMTVTRSSVDGSVTDEPVEFYLDELGLSKVVIEVPGLNDGNYIYKVKSNFLSSSGLATLFPTIEVDKQLPVVSVWDFENLDSSADTTVARGEYTKAKKISGWNPFTIAKSYGGTYMFSYDLYHDKSASVNVVTYPDAGNAWFQAWVGSDGFRRCVNNTTSATYPYTSSQNLGVGYVYGDTGWYRIDNIMYIDQGYAEMYCNGQFMGTQPLWGSFGAENPLALATAFSGIQFYSGGINIDNVIIKDKANTYNAKLVAENDLLKLSFDETTYDIDENNITLSVKPTADSDAEAVEYTLAYKDASTVVLKLDSNVIPGATYSVKLAGVSSFFGTPLASNTVSVDIPSMADNVKFVDASGNKTDKANVASDTKAIEIYLANGFDYDMSVLSYSLTAGDETVTLTDSFDANTNILTLTADKFLGAGKDYTFEISGIADPNMNYYDSISMSFTTGAGKQTVSQPVFNTVATGVSVNVAYVNTKSAATYKLIFAGYENGKLKDVEIKDLALSENKAETKTITTDGAFDYSEVTVFIWDGITTMNPITLPVTIQQNKDKTYTYTLGTVQDFSVNLNGTDNSNIVTEDGYGNVLSMGEGQSYVMNLADAVGGKGTKYLLSFDMKVTKGNFNRLHLSLNSNTEADTETFNWTELFMTYAGTFWDGGAWGNNYNLYDAEWTHVDLMLVFDDGFVHAYTKGGSGTGLLKIDEKREINQIKGIKFNFTNANPATEVALVDNVFFTPVINANEVRTGTIKRVSDTKLELGFNTTIHSTTDVEAKMTVTRSAVDGSVTDEPVEFTLDELGLSKVVIEVPALNDGNYIYSVNSSIVSSSGLVTRFPTIEIN